MPSPSFSKLLAIYANDNKNSHTKSSHWSSRLTSFAIIKSKVKGIHGFSPRSVRIPIFSYWLHLILQALNFPNFISTYTSKWYSIVDSTLLKQRRCLDNDAFRHVSTFLLLDNLIDLSKIKTVCVIGDGQANFTLPALESRLFQKVISVNLTEILISDLELISMSGIEESSISVCDTSEDLCTSFRDKSVSLVIVPASKAQILYNQPINLFVNIASFQEMTLDCISEYFSIIKSSVDGAYLYCCNRESKKLEGGEIINFNYYPWQGYTDIMVDSPCPWHQSFYTTTLRRFPIPLIKRRYDGPICHRLLQYPKILP